MGLIISESFVCGYIVPLCEGENEKEFEELKAIEYVKDVLKDKPDLIKNDDFLDKLYE